METWTIEDALKTYHIENWGLGYFGVNQSGNIVVYPKRTKDFSIEIKKVVDDILEKGIKLPVLVRFQDILRHRVIYLNETFKSVIEEYQYSGRYQGVYPIKVNQLREVVEEILDAGETYDFGLEAGSKAELLASIAMCSNKNALILCNGFKDETIIKTALTGIKMGKRVIVIIEKLSELNLVIECSKQLNVRPEIGIRCKLHAKGSGKWESSGGDNAKFGLTTTEILKLVEILKDNQMLECAKLIHFHIGSQVTEIQAIRDAVKEASRFYAKLKKMGLNLEFLDVGGGLAVDYIGSQSVLPSSMNYTLTEYVRDVVSTIQEICKDEKVSEPNIVSESGRALVAHHSVLIVNVFGKVESFENSFELNETQDEAQIVKKMRETLSVLNSKNIRECYNDAAMIKEEAHAMFKLGILELNDKAKVENLFWKLCIEIQNLLPKLKHVPNEILEIKKFLASQYLCNFSLFQSAPDSWAINHLFPVLPIHRLNEKPTKEATLVDITCDSDGKIDKFIDLEEIKDTLALHEINGEPYFLGMFLMGAYQDIMGDVHNLFARVNEVHVFSDIEEDNGFYIEEIIKGNTVAEVLSGIQYNPAELVKKVKLMFDVQVKNGQIKPKDAVDFLNFFEKSMNEYTYLNS